MIKFFALLFFVCMAAGVIYCAAYAAFCAWKKKTGAFICALALTILSGGAYGLLIAYALSLPG